MLSVAPLVVQAESFDPGGEGVGYHDSDTVNRGGAYRTSEGVDIQACSDTGGGYNVGWTKAGEWLQYTLNVAEAGTYHLDFRMASPATAGKFHVNVDGVNTTGGIKAPSTGGWQTWTTVSSNQFSLTAGKHVFRVVFGTNGTTGQVANLNWLRLVQDSSSATPSAPAAPSGLTAGATSTSAVTLNWIDNATNETAYQIERKTGSTGTYATIATLAANTTNYSDSGLAASTQYSYRVVAVNGTLASAYSNEASVTTPAAPVTLTPTWTNTGFATQTGPFTAEFDATPQAANMDVVMGLANGSTTSYAGMAAIARFNNTGTIDARNGGGYAAAANLAYSAGTKYHFKFVVNVSSHTYDLFVTAGSTTVQIASGYAFRSEQASVSQLNDLSSYNSSGGAVMTAPVVAATSPTPTAPAAPTGLSAAVTGSSSTNVYWTDNATNESGYLLERSADGTTFMQVAALPAGTTSYADTNLAAATRYYYRVRAYNSAGNSAYSNLANVMTMAATTGQMTWTTFTPSADTRKIYVSSSTGSDSNSGLDAAHPVATLAKGYALMRDGYPDWLLLKSGDTWVNQTLGSWRKSGRSTTAPMLVSSYGAGAQPVISNNGDGMNSIGNGITGAYSHVAVTNLHFVGQGTGAGIFILGNGTDWLIENVTIEGFESNITVEADNRISSMGPSDVRLRGSRLLDAYNATSAKAQGLFADSVDGMVLEYNVFDHNGWKSGVQAPDVYSHNVYVDNMTNLTVRGNVLANASSYGLLVRSETANATAHVLIEGNLFVGDGNGMTVGGWAGDKTWHQYGAVDVTIRNNVLTEIGRNIGGADQSYGIQLGSINGGTITNNLLFNKSNAGTSFGIVLDSPVASQNVTISGNVIYNWRNGYIEIGSGPLTNIVVQNNTIQDNLYGSDVEVSDGALPNSQVKYSGNTYYSSDTSGNWFSVNGTAVSLAKWLSLSQETNAIQQRVAFPDASRTLSTYSAFAGGAGTTSALIAAERQQSQANWHTEYATESVIKYLMDGFGMTF